MTTSSAAKHGFNAGEGGNARSGFSRFDSNFAECRFVVVYEDDESRARALALCNQLEIKLARQLQLDTTWWRFRYFEEPEVAAMAGSCARQAQVILFASNSPGFFPPAVMRWVDSWIDRREIDHGAIVPLVDSPFLSPQIFLTRQIYLRHVATRAGMDYLNPRDFAAAVTRTREKALAHKYPDAPVGAPSTLPA